MFSNNRRKNIKNLITLQQNCTITDFYSKTVTIFNGGFFFEIQQKKELNNKILKLHLSSFLTSEMVLYQQMIFYKILNIYFRLYTFLNHQL